MDIKKYLTQKVKEVFDKFGYPQEKAIVSFSNVPDCDFQCNGCFAISKIEKCNPMEIANKIKNELKSLSSQFNIEVANPGFLNFTASNDFLSKVSNDLLNDKSLGVEKHNQPQKVIMDYGGANVAKQLHIGHLRSPIIGEGLKRLFILLGDNVISDTHLGDWGLQMGLTIANIMEKFDCEYYFKGSGTKPQITVEMLNQLYPEASARSKVDEDFKKLAQEITVKLQNKTKGYYDIWQDIRKTSVNDIKIEYDKLNTNFDLWMGESDAQEYIEDVYKTLNKKKLIKFSEGAEIVEVATEEDKKPMPPVIVKSSTGAGLYATTDIATIIQREKDYNPDMILYITDNRQNMHFDQVFRCCRLADIVSPQQKLEHIGFGTINGKDGKPFKTREGGTVKLNEIIKMVTDKAEEKLKANGVDYDDKLALQIGIAAIKFGDLINVVTKDYIFDIDKFLSFEGKTGPYLQYTAVRIKSLLNKAKENAGEICISTNEEKQIIIDILKLLDSYETCYKELSLNSLCNAVYCLASSFSTFYNNYKILTEKDDKQRKSYLALSKLVLLIMQQALNVLAIDIPEKM